MGAYLLENTIFFLKACGLIIFNAVMIATIVLAVGVIIEERKKHKDN